MNARSRLFWMLAAVILWPVPALLGQQKLAQTGMKFLNVASDARGAALGGGMAAIEGYSSAMFFNPAGIARINSTVNFCIGRTQWIADINHTFASVAIKPWQGDYGVIGFSLQSVDYGEMYETIRSTNTQGYIELGTFNPTAIAVSMAYGRAVSDQFSFGANVKYVKQYLGNAVVARDSLGRVGRKDNTAGVPAVDFGIFYHTPFRGVDFGMAVRNFSREARFEDEDFQLPLTFKIGLTVNLMDVLAISKDDHEFRLVIDAEHPRDFREQVRVGGEYTIYQMFSLRAGYVTQTDEEGLSLGIGHWKQYDAFWFGLDYAYTPFGVFGNVHRFTLQFAL